MNRSVQILGGLILILIAVTVLVWWVDMREARGNILTVRFLDVGQGDAIFVEAPSGAQLLIDGGPANGGLMRRLGSVMPWWDRTIDMVIPTHPDADHSAGLIPVFRRYAVGMVLLSSVRGSTPTWDTLSKEIEAVSARGARVLTAQRGQIVDLGGGAYLEILSPDRAVPAIETNTGCVVGRLVYGATAFMLTCDAPQTVEKYLVSLDGSGLKSDVLKAGHHGSRTSSAPLFVGTVNPTWAVYSRSCDNSYGFPHAETIETYAAFGIPVLDTCASGSIVFESDGSAVRVRQ